MPTKIVTQLDTVVWLRDIINMFIFLFVHLYTHKIQVTFKLLETEFLFVK